MNKYISKGAKLMVYTSNLSTLETEVGGLPDQGQPRLQSKTVSQKKKIGKGPQQTLKLPITT
jgi:hypothetical protein